MRKRIVFCAPKLPGRQRRLFEDPAYSAYKAERRRLEALGRISRPDLRDRDVVRRYESLGLEERGRVMKHAAEIMNADKADAGLRGPAMLYLEIALDELGAD